MNIQQTTAIGLGVLALAAAGGLVIRFHLGRRRADRVWAAASYPKLKDIGAVKHLTILPLIDRHTAHDDPLTSGSTGPSTPLRTGSLSSSGQALAGEPGVSYLVRADDTTILFDVGLNPRGGAPFPAATQYASPGGGPEEY